jgi:hypothetical protein
MTLPVSRCTLYTAHVLRAEISRLPSLSSSTARCSQAQRRLKWVSLLIGASSGTHQHHAHRR